MIVVEDGYFFDMPIKWLKEHDKQVREEVIDEVIKRIKNITNKDTVVIDKVNLDQIAEQLKEKNNG